MEVHVISRGCLFQAGTAGGDSCDEEMVDSVIARMTADPMDDDDEEEQTIESEEEDSEMDSESEDEACHESS